ncbi:NACHT domain-containing protein [Streptomyces antibioticus]|uniref:NACHT domain-containing protein n=1 Tax=Streptomyces antibioticus TaxID=1890 RepID=UPI00368901A8
MSIEAAAIGVGRSVVQLVAGRWLSARATRTSAPKDLVELIKTGMPDEIKRRKTERQFEAIADAVTERLLTFTRQEFGGLSDGDREAVLHQVILTLDRADLSDDALLADDMDPVKLARRLHRTLPARQAEFQLGEAGNRLYEVVLDECCDCLARIFVSLPQFEPRASVETLARLTRTAEQVEMVLSRLPARSLIAPEGTSEDEAFSRQYLASISQSLDTLELLGLRLERFARPQTALSVAYVSLTVSREDGPRAGRAEAIRISEWRSGERENVSVRVEQILGDQRLMLIRGEAGGGKSTLLRWLAVTAARGNFVGELSNLNGFVPFLIKLRSHAGRPLPRPEEYLDDVAGNLTGIMPRGWVHRKLLSGQAMVLVDGVDEVAAPQRQAVREWLKEIIAQFPDIRVVVTSRPPAATVGWLRSEGFDTAFLEQLSPAGLRSLVQHWHGAVRDCADLPCPPERLPSYEAKLLARLESAPHLRALAATPLLAAMLCSLNIDREALPRDRMGLYAAALDMLLETRDAKRNVPSARTIPLEREQKTRILQDLAWQLSASARVELPKSMVERLIADRLTAMPQVRVGADVVLEALLHRSGIIREPIPGRIDFVHRTVQEYLAAKQVADLGDMDLLVRNAHHDHWRETIVMAAGHANEPLRRELVMGILGRVREEPRKARRLRLLAVACLETLPSIPQDLKVALDECLDALVPPRDHVAARSLATAGEPVLAKLPESLDGLPFRTAEASIQTAWLINGPEALDVLSRYAADQRDDVQFEMSLAWEYFDPEEYAERVLAAMPPGGRIYIQSPAQFAALGKVSPLSMLEASLGGPVDLSGITAHAASLHSLSIYFAAPGVDPNTLPELPNLRSLAFGFPEISDLQFLDALPSLDTIWSTDCKNIEDYSPLLRFTNLSTLVLFHSQKLRSLRQLPPLEKVLTLALSASALNTKLESLVAAAPRTSNLYLDYCDWLDEDLGPLVDLQLGDLRVRGSSTVNSLGALSQQAKLSFLDVSRTQVSDLSPLEELPELRTLRLSGCSAVSDLRPLAALPELRELRIEGVAAGIDLSPLAMNEKLAVYIAARQEVRGAESLETRLRVN